VAVWNQRAALVQVSPMSALMWADEVPALTQVRGSGG